MPSGLAAAQMLLPVAKFGVGGQPVQDWYIATFSPVTSHKQRRIGYCISCVVPKARTAAVRVAFCSSSAGGWRAWPSQF